MFEIVMLRPRGFRGAFLAKRGLLRENEPMNEGEKMGKTCGAKTRAGTPCKRGPMPNGRCKLHGGKSGPPKRNTNAVKHGLLVKFLPDDPELHDIINSLGEKSPLDIIWDQIVVQYTAIVRAQKIMFVRSQADKSKELKRERTDPMTGDIIESEYEIQYAWDKQANFLQAQSRAMSTLMSLIRQYEEMLPDGVAMEEHKLRIAKLKAETERLKNPEGDAAEDWATALEIVAERRRQKNNG